ncbi:MAG: hypothetical protein K2X03_04715 [Bryobacteraceae bacterium]|nr:hypothetical protein [Bryobacteraceae bacterium]
MIARSLALAALALATTLGFLYFPGHHYLQQDTQIWLPVLAHAQDPALFRNELIVTGAHVRLTIYDDATLALARWGGMSIESALLAQQLLFRFLAMLGIWLLARATGLTQMTSVLAATLASMGATIIGPAVLSVEYEPVPRGFAFGLMLLSLGCAAHQRFLPAGLALGLAFAYHAPAVWPILLVAAYTFWRNRKGVAPALVGFLAGVALLGVTVLASDAGPMNPLFARLSESHADLQRMRATYNWISLWANARTWVTQYAALAALAGLAYWRLGKALPATVRPHFAALPAIGLLSIPLSYLLLEQLRLAIIPQVQIMRSLLFTLMFAVILLALAGLRAARWYESPLWLWPVCFVPLAPVWTGKPLRIYLVAAGLAVAAALAASLEKRYPRAALAIATVVFAGCFFAPESLAKVRNYTELGDANLTRLVQWARDNTDKDDVFLFRDSGTRNEPGLFRARALRAVYVDWKGGGQVNYYEFYANEWWRRWQRFMKYKFTPTELPALREAGVGYLVFRQPPPGFEQEPVYANDGYRVYRLK